MLFRSQSPVIRLSSVKLCRSDFHTFTCKVGNFSPEIFTFRLLVKSLGVVNTDILTVSKKMFT